MKNWDDDGASKFTTEAGLSSELGYSVSVVIPVYRSERMLPELSRQLAATLPAITKAYEVIFVEDGGNDGSWTVIASIAATDPQVRGIRMSRNYGQHNALLCGIRAARYEVILTMDDDLQHPVSEIAPMLAALRPDFDVVYGTPQVASHGVLRNVASYLTKLALASAIGAATARDVSAFRAFRTRLREGFHDFRSPFVSIDVLLTWATTRFTAISVRHAPRAEGVSGYSMGKLVRHAFNLMTGFSSLPLQGASMAGFAFVLFGVLILAFVLGNFLVHGSAVPGFAFLASLVVMFSGAQLFALGIFGEYLARMHFRSMDRPVYLVAETVAPRDSATPAVTPITGNESHV
jgi:glycosyltransferase involved in cell wall biosynthesis